MENLISEFDIISFDIFDTILCRLVSQPEDLFLKIGKGFVAKFPTYHYSPQIFKELRKKAEKTARKKNEEVTLTEIYEQMPWSAAEKQYAYQLELELELKYTYLNTEMLKLIDVCCLKQKKIILVSDMYLNKAQVEWLLQENGFDLNKIDKVFVSSEYGVSKKNGRLFNYVKDHYVDKKILHIGDNYNSDYLKAKQNDIAAIHYDNFSRDNDLIFEMEKSLLGKTVPELESLRKTLKISNLYSYNIGIQIFGPVFAAFIDWILDYCIQHEISEIRPLMREGHLFTKLLNNAIRSKGLTIKVEPLYVSRKSTYLFDKESIDETDIQQLLWRKNFKVKDLFELLQLRSYPTWLKKFQTVYIEDLENICSDNVNIQEKLYNYLTTEAVITEIRKAAKEQIEYFELYIKQGLTNNNFVTIDLGYNGTIQSQLDYVLKDYNLHHLILLGGEKFKDCLFKGMHFSSFLGSLEEDDKIFKKIIKGTQVIESVINISQGSTEYYTLLNNEIKPVLDNINYPEHYISSQKHCWEGIIEFQKHWLCLTKKKPFLKESVSRNKMGISTIIFRFLSNPLFEEANIIGDFMQHESFKFSRVSSIIKRSDYHLLKELGIDKFLEVTKKVYFPYDVIWPEGTIAKTYPSYFINAHTRRALEVDEILMMMYEQLNNQTILNAKNIYIYGAGEIGEKVAKILNMLDVNYNGFIDRNAVNMNHVYLTKKCVTLEEFEVSDCQIIVASFAFKNQIAEEINKKIRAFKCSVDIILFET